jgi:uncharacterized protein YjbJ (UPF0337 family)
MSSFREKAQGRTKQMVGEMIGDGQLVEEGQEQVRKAEQDSGGCAGDSSGSAATSAPSDKAIPSKH